MKHVISSGLAGLAAVVAIGVSVSVAGANGGGPALLPDVIEEVPHHLQIQNTQQREWLRFSTTHINIGEGNLQIRGGGQIAPCDIDGVPYDQCTIATQEILDAAGNVVQTHPAGVALFHPEHNHWHQSAVAEFKITTAASPSAPAVNGIESEKITFCFVDVEFAGFGGKVTGSDKKAKPRTYFECNGDLQGLASGWADSYHQSTPLQELDVTGLPDGVYFLTHFADPDGHWLEANDGNNFTWVKFRLSRTGANAEVTVRATSPCVPSVICGFGGNP